MFQDKIEKSHGSCYIGNDIQLYQEQVGDILGNIKKPGESGTLPKIAIISQTYFSRNFVSESLCREISTLVKRINFQDIIIRADDMKNLFDEQVIYICEECQFLFERHPHGFDILRAFLSAVITNRRQIITTWNQYSWNYLSGFIHIERWFPKAVSLPFLELDDLKSYLLLSSDENLVFCLDRKLNNPIDIVRRKYSLSLDPLNLTLEIPYITLQKRYTNMIPFYKKNEVNAEDFIIRAIHQLSLGEPGISNELFNKAIHEGQLCVSNIPEPATIPPLSPHEMYILTLILMYEQPTYSYLIRSVHDDSVLNSALYRLMASGVIYRDEENLALTPEGFAPAVRYLMQRRMIW